jgi:hypothetical protein
MEKRCVFCGQRPQNKTREHVLPLWLIEATGDPKRRVQFGWDGWDFSKPRIFSYDSFVFPACNACNDNFSQLEAIVKPLLQSLLERASLSSFDFHHLLDWFDKVRIGLWLAFRYLDRNMGKIQPRFHIAQRLGIRDRMLFIIRVDGNKDELSFRGCNTPCFYYTPSCFSMIINNVSIINISSPFLTARRLGFPYPHSSHWLPDGFADYVLVRGRERIMFPIIPRSFRFEGVAILQPLFRGANDAVRESLYSSYFVQANTMNMSKGIGKVFIEMDQKAIHYPDEKSMMWIPKRIYNRKEMNPNITIVTLELQDYIDTLSPSYDTAPASERQWWAQMLRSNKTWNRQTIATLRRNARNAGLSIT